MNDPQLQDRQRFADIIRSLKGSNHIFTPAQIELINKVLLELYETSAYFEEPGVDVPDEMYQERKDQLLVREDYSRLYDGAAKFIEQTPEEAANMDELFQGYIRYIIHDIEARRTIDLPGFTLEAKDREIRTRQEYEELSREISAIKKNFPDIHLDKSLMDGMREAQQQAEDLQQRLRDSEVTKYVAKRSSGLK